MSRYARHVIAIVTLLAVLPAKHELALADTTHPNPNSSTWDSSDRRAPDPTGEITLAESVAAALTGSPDLAVFSAEIRALDARALQAGLAPNPVLTTEVEDFARTGDGSAFRSTQTTLSLSQLVELGGKRLKRRQVAELDKDRAIWDYEVRRAEVLFEVTDAFLQVLSLQEKLALTDELVGLATASVDSVATQVVAGAVSPVERQRAEMALATTRLERPQLEHELVEARTKLAAAWGSSAPRFTKVRGDLTAVRQPAPIEVFVDRVHSNPELARWSTEIAGRLASLDLERARRKPDFTLGAGTRWLNEDSSFAGVIEFSVPLPLFDRNQGAILEASERLAKARAEREAAAIAVRSGLTGAYQRLHAAYDRLTSLRDKSIPAAATLYQQTREGHSRGLFRYLEVLDAQRTLFELRREYLDSLFLFHRSLAEVERLSGTSIYESETRATSISASPKHDTTAERSPRPTVEDDHGGER
jgi:cobalt-zinc-cadmium efflux system outer membrane protein